MRIRKNDMVVLNKAVTGAKQTDGRALGKEEKGSVARVLKVLADGDRAIVEGVNYVYRHVRRSQKNPQGGRVAKEAPVHLSNVNLFCAKCNGPTRVQNRHTEKVDSRGKRRREVLRICKRCGEAVGGSR
jgi:large subunit ribosomal protein L24